MPRVDYTSLQCCSLWLLVQLAVQCSEPGLCSSCCNELLLYVLCNTMIIISGTSVQFNYTHCTWSDNSHHSEEAVAILEL